MVIAWFNSNRGAGVKIPVGTGGIVNGLSGNENSTTEVQEWAEEAENEVTDIVGGGTGGAVLANNLAEKLDTEIDAGEAAVTPIHDGPDHVYKPVWLYVAFGQREPADGRRPLRELIDDRVEIKQDYVYDINSERRELEFVDAVEPFGYDRLVIVTGSQLDPDRVPGLAEDSHHFYDEGGAQALRDELLELDDGHIVHYHGTYRTVFARTVTNTRCRNS